MTKDFMGNILSVGDVVIGYKIGERQLVKGHIINLPKVKITIEYEEEEFSFERDKDNKYHNVSKGIVTKTTSLPPYQVAKIPKEEKAIGSDPRLKAEFDLSPATMLALYKGELHVPDFKRLPESRQARQEIEYYEKIIKEIKNGS